MSAVQPETPPGSRILGLSPKARETLLWLVLVAAVAIPLSYGLGQRGGKPGGLPAGLGGDPSAIAAYGSRVYVGGESGAAVALGNGMIQPIRSLGGHDVMAWAKVGSRLMAGAHDGLYVAADDGADFTAANRVPVIDVHGLGAVGTTVYLSSPDGGFYVSGDGGATFSRRSSVGADVMGSIWVDPHDPQTAIAPSMGQGAIMTTDGGTTWRRLGGPESATAITVKPGTSRLLVVGTNDVETSADMGRNWMSMPLPSGTTTATYAPDGALIVGTSRTGDWALLRNAGSTWKPVAETAS